MPINEALDRAIAALERSDHPTDRIAAIELRRLSDDLSRDVTRATGQHFFWDAK